ncbi:hypothetical protein [Candidatus Enterovibrio escicola]|uniref:hypothetical protein n=1 Tax=Candidatus Enterovibrio escicola TaxID=1927127 RepID=UPI001CC2572E|nr:hypothetical protein [Candidatus Enterovibrio escacola]
MAMDIYVILADRLHRINDDPLVLHWCNLWEQFGQEYGGSETDKNFKKKFILVRQQVLAIYLNGKVK